MSADLQLHPLVRQDIAKRLAEQKLTILPIHPTPAMQLAGSKALLDALEIANVSPTAALELATICYYAMIEVALGQT